MTPARAASRDLANLAFERREISVIRRFHHREFNGVEQMKRSWRCGYGFAKILRENRHWTGTRARFPQPHARWFPRLVW
jgi:hypothetical protein